MSARARIFQHPKTAMQSGMAGTHEWVFEYAPSAAGRPDPLMGWIGGADTSAQVRLRFDSREEAISYAAAQGVAYDVELPHARKFRPKSYADNFRFGLTDNWTH